MNAGSSSLIFSNTSPSYARLTPVAGSSSSSGLGTPAIAAIVAAGVLLLAGLAFVLLRRRSVEERE